MTTPTSDFRPPPLTRVSSASVKIAAIVPDDLPVFPSLSPLLPSSLPKRTITLTHTAMGNTPDYVPPSPKMLRPIIHIPSNPTRPPTPFQQSCPVISPSPTICTSHFTSPATSTLPSPMARSRRSVSPSQTPPMHILSSPYKHTLVVQLPTAIQPDMVTISANKGDRLKVVADAWHMESDCHYEWQICFPPRDIDMSSVHAKFDPDGHLTIDVRRLPNYSSTQG